MRNMLRNLFLAPVVMAAAALATHPAMAQSVNVAKVPFNFVVNGHMWPAGRYTIRQSMNGNVVEVANTNQPFRSMWVISPGDPAPTDTRVLLSFDVQGATHTLHSVQYRNMETSSLDGRQLSLRYGSDLIVPGQ
ncbi:MAG TPA: hypothetical protein DGA22_12580 [Acidobacterium sp.]|uniref:Lipoprotein n=2 Tax=Acidobacteriaceae TaxID=204434 RepID=C1F9U8_ACIC5|nr:hypothetical protein ACP_0324 [Acidobacterium capsulatum ATCC 51196]HCT61691.1 hypothetical protein [Acidobacterium sp.]